MQQEKNEELTLQLSEGDVRAISERAKDFGGLLQQIESLNDKKRQLWREIYVNAITDRQNSYVMFVKLARIAQDKSTEHAVHGKTIATYIERMSRANEQLIKLASMIAEAEEGPKKITEDDIFDQIKDNV